MTMYYVFDSTNKLVITGTFVTDASARRWFQLRGFNKPGWALTRELNDEMIEIKTY